MIYGIVCEAIDELVANLLLYQFFRYRRRGRAVGPDANECPHLYEGNLSRFFAPAPVAVELDVAGATPPGAGCPAARDFRFPSAVMTAWPENNQVWCRHWAAPRSIRPLTLVGVHGIVQLGSSWFSSLANRLAPAGIDVVMMDAPFNHRRTPAGYRPGQLILGGDLGHQLAVSRQGVLDLWRLVVSLQQMGRRVGLLGVSYGGWLSLLTGLLADDLEFIVAIAPPADLLHQLRRGGTLIRAVRAGLGQDVFKIHDLDQVARPILPAEWQPRLSADRVVLHAGRYDRFVSKTAIENLSRLWGARLVLHNEAHCRLTMSHRFMTVAADEIAGFWPHAPDQVST